MAQSKDTTNLEGLLFPVHGHACPMLSMLEWLCYSDPQDAKAYAVTIVFVDLTTGVRPLRHGCSGRKPTRPRAGGVCRT